jgi:large subunit ribosomal protein L23
MHPTHVLKKPLLTEKSTFASNELGRYCFIVDLRATKADVKSAVEAIYKVNVEKVNTQIRKARDRRMKYGVVPGKLTKLATVRLKEGQSIELV